MTNRINIDTNCQHCGTTVNVVPRTFSHLDMKLPLCNECNEHYEKQENKLKEDN